MRIAIVAMAPGRQPELQGHDVIYGLAWDAQIRHNCTHLFEPHTNDWYLPNKPSYVDEVDDLELPVYVQTSGRFENELDMPELPKELDYLESSFAYMLAVAILKQPEVINVYGIRMAADEEYAYQRANAEYLIGYARGKGIEVNVHNSTVCEYSRYFKQYPKRYGLTEE